MIDHYVDEKHGLDVSVHRGYYSGDQTEALFQQLAESTPWFRVRYHSERHGNQCETPCYTNFYGGVPGLLPYQEIPEQLRQLEAELHARIPGLPPFNAVLVRLYDSFSFRSFVFLGSKY